MNLYDPAQLALLSEEEQLELQHHLSILVGGETPAQFIARVFPHEPPPRHLTPILDVMEQARVRPLRICLAMGPGTSKTTTLQRCIAWWLSPERSPRDLCAYVSYSDEQARDKSRIAKQALEAAGHKLDPHKKADGFWLTPQGGGLVAKGARAGVMGKRIPGLFVYDDPYKDVMEARSAAINNQVITAFRGMGFTRLQGGSIVVLHTRYDENDLIGWILKNLGWDYINVPSVCDDPATDILGREMGEVAWPEKYPYELCSEPCGHDGHLIEQRKTLGEHLWFGMHQGKPRPDGQQIFHEPGRFQLHDDKRTGKKSEFSWTGKRGVISIDPAATARKKSDWSVIMTLAVAGFGIETVMWIIDVVRIQVEIPDLVARARRIQRMWGLMAACEAVAGFKGVPQSLRAIDGRDEHGRPIGKLRVVDVTPGSKDKFTRAIPGAAAWNQSRVLVPTDAEWADPMIERFQRFTGVEGGVDDEVDAFSQGFNVLYRPVAIQRQGYREDAAC